jgi:type II secretory ATPase GspE/PulE/Tfp pilus assembly ATPase PilB-like protein
VNALVQCSAAEQAFVDWQVLPPQKRGVTFEVLFYRQLQQVIQGLSRVADILIQAVGNGIRTAKMNGMEKILMGLTDIKQVRAVCIK